MKVEKRDANVFGFLLLTQFQGAQVLVKKDDISVIRPGCERDEDGDDQEVIRITVNNYSILNEYTVCEDIDEIFYQMKECNFYEGD